MYQELLKKKLLHYNNGYTDINPRIVVLITATEEDI